MTEKVLVYIEINNNKLEKVSKEIVSHSKHNFLDSEVIGLLLTDKADVSFLSEDINNLGLDKLLVSCNNAFADFNSSLFANTVASYIAEICPDVLLMGATCDGRELAPRLASKLNIGLTADCTDLQIDENKTLLATRPTYGGKMMATIISKTKPSFATVRQGAFKFKPVSHVMPEIIYRNDGINESTCHIDVISTNIKPEIEDWTTSDVIVAGGLGLKSKENFELIYNLCDLIGAKPAASRAAVELGWAKQDIQVGQTGSSVAPKMYIALGISGALQHMTGISNADKIIAVNIDENAPIMASADIAIPADAVTIIKSMIHKLSH